VSSDIARLPLVSSRSLPFHLAVPWQRCVKWFYNNLQACWDCQTQRKSHKTTRIVGWNFALCP